MGTTTRSDVNFPIELAQYTLSDDQQEMRYMRVSPQGCRQ
jgi:hypothetical protein